MSHCYVKIQPLLKKIFNKKVFQIVASITSADIISI
jgi:hypothetical protein